MEIGLATGYYTNSNADQLNWKWKGRNLYILDYKLLRQGDKYTNSMNKATLEHVFVGLQAGLINFPDLSTINVVRINLNQVEFEVCISSRTPIVLDVHLFI